MKLELDSWFSRLSRYDFPNGLSTAGVVVWCWCGTYKLQQTPIRNFLMTKCKFWIFKNTFSNFCWDGRKVSQVASNRKRSRSGLSRRKRRWLPRQKPAITAVGKKKTKQAVLNKNFPKQRNYLKFQQKRRTQAAKLQKARQSTESGCVLKFIEVYCPKKHITRFEKRRHSSFKLNRKLQNFQLASHQSTQKWINSEFLKTSAPISWRKSSGSVFHLRNFIFLKEDLHRVAMNNGHETSCPLFTWWKWDQNSVYIGANP